MSIGKPIRQQRPSRFRKVCAQETAEEQVVSRANERIKHILAEISHMDLPATVSGRPATMIRARTVTVNIYAAATVAL